MICGNKISQINSRNVLYSKRYEIIQWYESNSNKLFSLYGSGWDQKFYTSNLRRKFDFYLDKTKNEIPLSVYKGVINNKAEILKNVKYAFCLENVVENSYITEKIFDCFIAGCIPIYQGPANISQHIPKNTYIDFENFNSIPDLHNYLKSISEYTYNSYRDNILTFLNTKSATEFSDYNFSEIVSLDIVKNLRKY
jgi:hypothetical protein